jgi:hypothetical protein
MPERIETNEKQKQKQKQKGTEKEHTKPWP